MSSFKEQGNEIRRCAKQLVLDFMSSSGRCGVSGSGVRQAEIFRECGFDWGDHEKAESTRQQFWIVGLLKQLEMENRVEQVTSSSLWRLKEKR